jgi:hypothetical protein
MHVNYCKGSACDNALCGEVMNNAPLSQRSSGLASSITNGITSGISTVTNGIATGLEAINPLKLVTAISDQIDSKGKDERRAKAIAEQQAILIKKATPAPLQRWKIATEFQSFMDNILSPVVSEIEFQNQVYRYFSFPPSLFYSSQLLLTMLFPR